MQKTLRNYGVWLWVLPALITSLSFAEPASTVDIRFWAGSDAMQEWTPSIINTGSGYALNNATNSGPDATIAWYNTTLNFDPFMSASVSVSNGTPFTQTYTLIFTLPISPAITSGSVMGGSVQGGLTDANFDGIGTLSTVGPGTALYYGLIDGNPELPLFPDLKTINVLFAGGSASDTTSAGLPGPTIPGLNAFTSIGIKHQFSLTSGDLATFTSSFIVQPVPEPASLSLLAVGALLVLRRRR